MNSLERMKIVLDGGIPDRVPLYELAINPKVIEGINPGMNYFDFIDYWDIDALADAIYGLITYPALHRFLKEEGLKEVNNIKWEYAGQKVRYIYDRIAFAHRQFGSAH